MGNSTPSHTYTMSNIPLTRTAEEKDLGVIMDIELKFHKHTAYAVKKASKILELFRATFTCLDEITVPKIFYSNGETPFKIWERNLASPLST